MELDAKQLMFVGRNEVEVQDKRILAGSDSVVVENRYSLISPGTELALFTGTHIGFSDPDIKWARYPLAPGYASVGTVLFVGIDVKDYSVGDRVLHYQPHANRSMVKPGRDLIFKISEGIDVKRALFARFGQIAYTAVAASGKMNGYILVMGGGIIGNLCAQLFQIVRGRNSIIADLSQSRVDLALSSGVKAAFCTLDQDIGGSISSITNGEGVSTVVEATGVPSLVDDSLKVVERLGEVILLGSTRGKVEIDVYKSIHRKAISLIGAHEGRYPLFSSLKNEYSHEFFGREVLKMIEDSILKVDGFLTDVVPPSRVADAYNLLLNERDAHLGVLIDWNRS